MVDAAALPTATALEDALAECRADPHIAALLARAARRAQSTEVTCATFEGREIAFATDMRRDPIQRCHRKGAFYEREELDVLRALFPEGGTFVDIGANVGNHLLFFGALLGAGRLIPFEPNPRTFRLLVINVMLNALRDKVVFDFLGTGASDLDETGFGIEERHKNLGAARLIPGAGDISTVRPDDVLRDERPDIIKIDVEGMEMRVLRGLQKTIQRTRPVLLVEVDRENIHDFADWRLAHGFALPKSFKRYKDNRNFICVPEERHVALAGEVVQ